LVIALLLKDRRAGSGFVSRRKISLRPAQGLARLSSSTDIYTYVCMWKWEFVRSWKVARGRAQAGNLPRLSAARGKDGTFCYSRGIFEYEKAGSQGADDLSVKLTAVPGKRAEPIKMLGCLSYVVAKDSAEENNPSSYQGVGQRGQSRCLSIVTSGEECNSSSQSDRFEFQEGRCHKSSVGSRAETSAGSLSCGPERGSNGCARITE